MTSVTNMLMTTPHVSENSAPATLSVPPRSSLNDMADPLNPQDQTEAVDVSGDLYSYEIPPQTTPEDNQDTDGSPSREQQALPPKRYRPNASPVSPPHTAQNDTESSPVAHLGDGPTNDPPVAAVTARDDPPVALATAEAQPPCPMDVQDIQIQAHPAVPVNRAQAVPFQERYRVGYHQRLDELPPSLLISSMAIHLQWMSTMLYHTVRAGQLPPAAIDSDELARPTLVNTPLWPDRVDENANIQRLLRELAKVYANLALRPSYYR